LLCQITEGKRLFYSVQKKYFCWKERNLAMRSVKSKQNFWKLKK